MVEEDHRFFQGADENGDESLNSEEYMAFFFPHNYEHMHKFELERYMEQNLSLIHISEPTRHA